MNPTVPLFLVGGVAVAVAVMAGVRELSRKLDRQLILTTLAGGGVGLAVLLLVTRGLGAFLACLAATVGVGVAWVVWRRSGNARTVTRAGERARRRSGVATLWQVAWNGSRWAMHRKAAAVRPHLRDVGWRERWATPTTEVAVKLCRSAGVWLWASCEDVVLAIGGPRKGKALALDTPVPTPTGWTTMGALRDGDELYDETGQLCRVVRAHPIRHGRPCYEVVFSDRSVIVADAEHLWQVETRTSRKHHTAAKILTTEEMLSNFRVSSDGRANYSIRAAQPLTAPSAALPIEPYTLGAWLGDGSNHGGRITLGAGKASVVDEIRAAGYKVTRQPHSPIEYSVWGLIGQLRKADLLGNKHIPAVYFRSSEAQRRALLAGLLDTDGWCEKQGNVMFCSTRQQLAEDVRSLVATLGYVSTLRSRPARLNGRDCGTAWYVTFCPDQPVFRLARKAERQSTHNKASNKRRFIVDIRPTQSVPVRCITVDSPSSLYLVGDQCIPTHNTAWLAGAISDAPGAVLTTSTRTEIIGLTRTARERDDRQVWVFNPGGLGDLESTVTFNPLVGCQDPTTATARAADMIPEAEGNEDGRDFWDGQARRYFAAFLHAAALDPSGRRTMRDVQRWIASPTAAEDELQALLKLSPDPDAYLEDVNQFVALNDKTQSSITNAMTPALAWLTSPAAVAATEGGTAFDVATLLQGRGTVYLLGRHEAHTAPLLAALTGYVAREARRLAALEPAGRLDPPLTLALDEAARVSPVPLPDWSGDSGGSGIQLICAFQSRADLVDRWGPTGASKIINNANVVMLYGGTKDPNDLNAWASLAGDRDEVVKTRNGDGKVTSTSVRKTPVLAPAQLASLPKFRVVVFSDMPPAVGWVQPVWNRRGFLPWSPTQAPAPGSSPTREVSHPTPAPVAAPALPGVAVAHSPTRELTDVAH